MNNLLWELLYVEKTLLCVESYQFLAGCCNLSTFTPPTVKYLIQRDALSFIMDTWDILVSWKPFVCPQQHALAIPEKTFVSVHQYTEKTCILIDTVWNITSKTLNKYNTVYQLKWQIFTI